MANLKPGYPKQRATKDGTFDTWAYVGTIGAMAALRPRVGSVWQGLEVLSAEVSPIEDQPDYAELVIECGTPDPLAATTQTQPENPTTPVTPSAGDATTPVTPAAPPTTYAPPSSAATPASPSQVTNEEYPYLEIDQVPFERALRTHPHFSALTAANWNAIDMWEKETDTSARAAFQYWARDSAGDVTGSVQTLPTGAAQDYANLRLLGVEVFTDYAPVFRKTSKYKGNSAPSTADTGLKVSAPTGAPSGYEWIKTGDSARKQGAGNVWIRTEEWTGARTVIVDKDDIYITV